MNLSPADTVLVVELSIASLYALQTIVWTVAELIRS